MTDPRIITNADTVARLHSAALTIAQALGDDKIVMITVGDLPTACVGERDDNTGNWTAVDIDTGDVWHYDGDTVQAPADPVPVPVHVGDTAGRNGPRHLVNLRHGGECVCLERCCNDADENCICPDCQDPDHTHHRRG